MAGTPPPTPFGLSGCTDASMEWVNTNLPAVYEAAQHMANVSRTTATAIDGVIAKVHCYPTAGVDQLARTIFPPIHQPGFLESFGQFTHTPLGSALIGLTAVVLVTGAIGGG